MPGRYGYYLFLGLGDYLPPDELGAEWTSAWGPAEWTRRLDELVGLGANTLFVYLVGGRLPFPSERFPELVEPGHPNVESEFFQSVIDEARSRDMDVVAVLSTTGHARALTDLRPDLAIEPGAGAEPAAASAFPEGQHDDVVSDREGEAVVGSGILCHHKAGARAYAIEVARECLTRYTGFAGYVLHPPEFVTGCVCDECRRAYSAQTGDELLDAPDDTVRGFFMRTNLEFQRDELEPGVAGLIPGGKAFTFSIPWIFEEGFAEVAALIPDHHTIIEWDYNQAPARIATLGERIRRYGSAGHEVWFMPSAGLAFGEETAEAQTAGTLRQVEVALEAGAGGVIYFVGPYWYPYIEPTSWFLHR